MCEFEIQEVLKGLENAPEYFKRGLEAQLRQESKDRENLYRQTELLEGLLEDGKNAIEQRDAIIRFMVESIINSEKTTNESKKKLLQDILVPIAAVSSGTGDLVKLINDGLDIIG